MYQLRKAKPDELDRIVDFILPLQASAETRCLHLDWTRPGLSADIQDLDAPLNEAFWLACEGPELVGVLGLDQSLESGRGWLHGPFAREQDWETIVSMLFAAIWQALPAQITRVSNYLELANACGLDFHSRFGFVPKGVSHIYRAQNRPTQAPAGITSAEPTDFEALGALHQAAFPQSWLSGNELSAKIDLSHPLLVARHQGEPIGYIRLSRHVSLSEASVDFVAVAPSFQGQGLGRQLLEAGLDWIFANQRLETAFLNVSDDNTNALGLYQSAGFEPFQSGVALDWWRTLSPA
ncbi:MAG: hypothetical protein CVV27_13045 [Candidatus Melainabacteria bacterium HGW-Melainabacteria-1]|nr:MAG: hypothetical protein CVV27_13045 [Candidatus Melainabacteria bacterium HGW-Melainabacteria-1]